MICTGLGLPRRTCYDHAAPPAPADILRRSARPRRAAAGPTYGYRRRPAHLRRAGYGVNSKRLRRRMAAAGLLGHPAARRGRTTNSHPPFPRSPHLVQGQGTPRPAESGGADSIYGRVRSEFVYLAVLRDGFTRCIRGGERGRTRAGSLTLRALKRALITGAPAIPHADQGVQYAARGYGAHRDAAGVQIRRATGGHRPRTGTPSA